jgi:hypothetical protein
MRRPRLGSIHCYLNGASVYEGSEKGAASRWAYGSVPSLRPKAGSKADEAEATAKTTMTPQRHRNFPGLGLGRPL